MLHLIRTTSENTDFQTLVIALDKDLKVRDGDDHAFYAQFNKIDMIRYAIVAYEGETPVGCGAIKPYDDSTMEVKRMYVPLELRGKGIASQVLAELEKWCKELGYHKCILETGLDQPEAIVFIRRALPSLSYYGSMRCKYRLV